MRPRTANAIGCAVDLIFIVAVLAIGIASARYLWNLVPAAAINTWFFKIGLIWLAVMLPGLLFMLCRNFIRRQLGDRLEL